MRSINEWIARLITRGQQSISIRDNGFAIRDGSKQGIVLWTDIRSIRGFNADVGGSELTWLVFSARSGKDMMVAEDAARFELLLTELGSKYRDFETNWCNLVTKEPFDTSVVDLVIVDG